MALALRAVSTPQAGVAGTTVTGVEPTGTVQDDVVWALWITDLTATTQTLPTGWTSVASRTTSPNFSASFGYVVRGASAPSYTFSGGVGNPSFTAAELYLWSISGADTASVVDNAGTPVDAASSSSAVNPPSAVANFATDWAITVLASWQGAPGGGWTAPSGYTLLTGGPAGSAGAVAYQAQSSTGTPDPGVFGGTPASSDVAWAETVTIKASGGASASAAPRTFNAIPFIGGGL